MGLLGSLEVACTCCLQSPIGSLALLWACQLAVVGGVGAPDGSQPFAASSLLGPAYEWSACRVSYPDLHPYTECLLLYGT